MHEDLRRQERRRVDEREHHDRRSGRPCERGIITPNVRDRRDQRHHACQWKQHDADIFRRGRKTDQEPEYQSPARLRVLPQPVERREGEQQPRRNKDVLLEELRVERDQWRYRGEEAGGESKRASHHAARKHDRGQHGQAAEHCGDGASEFDQRELIGVPRDKVGKAYRLHQQQRLEEILTAREDEIRFLGLVRLRGERQVGDGVVGDGGHDRKRSGGARVSNRRAARHSIRRGATGSALAQLPGCHQQRIWGVMTVPATRFSVASHEVHWRT
jgi:hypothetical protein